MSTLLSEMIVPIIKEWKKVKWVILKKIENWVLVDCCDGAFTWVILSKEVKELERSGYELIPGREIELEIVNTAIRHEDGYYIVCDKIITIRPMEIYHQKIRRRWSDHCLSNWGKSMMIAYRYARYQMIYTSFSIGSNTLS